MTARSASIQGGARHGIEATGLSLTVERSEVFRNRLGGVRATGALVVEISNNFIYRNGRDPDSVFGGLLVDTTQTSNRVVHNTIVWNDMEPTAAYAGGFYCEGGGTFANNLVFNNFAGNTTQPKAQYAGTCGVSTTNNSIGYNTGTNDMRFVSETVVPFDYHLADHQSPAVDRGVAGQSTVDFDGEPRGDFPDMGADEVP